MSADRVAIGDRRTTTEPLGATDGSIIPAGTDVDVTGREQRGWTVQADDGRVAPWVASIQLGVDIHADPEPTKDRPLPILQGLMDDMLRGGR